MRSLTLLLSFATVSFAVQANDIFITQRDNTNSSNLTRFATFTSGVNSIVVMNGSTLLPQVATFAGGIEFDGTSLTTNNVPMGNVSGLTAALGAKASTASLATVATTGDYGDLINKPAAISSPTKSALGVPTLATAYQPSTTRWAVINTSGRLDTAISLTGASEAYLLYETCQVNTFTGGTLNEEGRIYNGNGGTLVIGLALNQKFGAPVAFSVPPSYYWRVTQVNINTAGGTPTATLYNGSVKLEY